MYTTSWLGIGIPQAPDRGVPGPLLQRALDAGVVVASDQRFPPNPSSSLTAVSWTRESVVDGGFLRCRATNAILLLLPLPTTKGKPSLGEGRGSHRPSCIDIEVRKARCWAGDVDPGGGGCGGRGNDE